MTISNEFAAEIVAKIRARVESRDELTTVAPVDEASVTLDLLILKIWDDLQALTKATAFLGGGIQPTRKVEG